MTRMFVALILWPALGIITCDARSAVVNTPKAQKSAKVCDPQATVPGNSGTSADQITCAYGGVLTIVGMPVNPPSIYSGKEVKVQYGNKFRYDLGAQTAQTPIGTAALPGGLGLSSAQVAAVPPVLQTSFGSNQPHTNIVTGGSTPPPQGPTFQQVCNQNDAWPSDHAAEQARITTCWNGIRSAIETTQGKVSGLRETINTTINKAAVEQRCYQLELWNFRQPILTPAQANALLEFAIANATQKDTANASGLGCQIAESDDWPRVDANKYATELSVEQQALSDLSTAPGFPNWNSTNKSANDELVKRVGDLLAEATSYAAENAATTAGSPISQGFSDFQNIVANNKQWRQQLANLKQLSDLEIDIAIDPCKEWYGKGRTDAIKLHAVDLSTATGPSQDIQLATNTCNPPDHCEHRNRCHVSCKPRIQFCADRQYGGTDNRRDRSE